LHEALFSNAFLPRTARDIPTLSVSHAFLHRRARNERAERVEFRDWSVEKERVSAGF